MDNIQNDYGCITLQEYAFEKKCAVYRLTTFDTHISIEDFFKNLIPLLINLINHVHKDCELIAQLKLSVQMIDENHADGNIKKKDVYYFASKMTAMYDVNSWINESINRLNNQCEVFVNNSSGWVIDYIKFAEFRYMTF